MSKVKTTMTQEEINALWSESAMNYNDIIDAELDSYRGKAWTKQILDQVPSGRQLSILDCGCGPGFFSVLMAEAGHRVTGIDASEEMLRYAKDRAKRRNLEIDFRLMDCHDLQLPDDCFDLIISRNVTHALRDHKQVYSGWKRVLKPEGILLIFDANWHLTQPGGCEEEEALRRYRECLIKYGSDFSGTVWDGTQEQLEELCDKKNHAGDEIWKYVLKDKYRPDWDMGLLEGIGFGDIRIERDITEDLWDDKEKLIYGNTPMFMIRAVNSADGAPAYRAVSNIVADELAATETESTLQEYWKKRSDTYSMQNLTEMNNWKRSMWRDLILANAGRTDEKQELKILDIGTGPGFFAINLALAGHAVTAVDITDEMLSHAGENARAYQAKVHFSKQGADKLTFDDNTFDLIVNRNVIWNLERPEEAFAEWRRVLKPGGRIVYFDANWYMYMFDDELRAERDKDWDEWKEKYGAFRDGHPSDRDKSHQKRAEGLEILAKEKLPLSGVMRPEWDKKTLTSLGMEIVEVKPDINEMIYDESEQLYYRSYPMFMVVAEKPV